MDYLDDEPTPEEQQAALMAELKARLTGAGGQQPQQQQPNAADFYQGWGNMNLRSGDRVLSGLGQAQIGQANHLDGAGAGLLRLLSAAKKPASAIANKGMWQALKAEYPELAANYQEGELSDAAAGKIYMQASANNRTNTAQKGANERVHYTQGETGKRFEKSFGLHSTRQTADLGARQVYGATPLDLANPKPMSQEQATHLADMKAAADTVIEKTTKAKDVYAKGAPLPGSQEDAMIRQLITETYGPMLKTGNIGNLTDSHLHLLQDMLKNPSGDWRTYFNNKLFPTMLDELARAAQDNLEHQAHSMGQTFSKKPGGVAHGSFDLDQGPSGLPADKRKRLEELRAKKAAGALK